MVYRRVSYAVVCIGKGCMAGAKYWPGTTSWEGVHHALLLPFENGYSILGLWLKSTNILICVFSFIKIPQMIINVLEEYRPSNTKRREEDILAEKEILKDRN